jgi:L-rhamnose mutarotase
VIRLRPEREAEYRDLHAHVWPTVKHRLSASNIGNYSIFLRDGYLFSYFEYTGNDFEGDMAAMRDDPETRRWWSFTDPCQHPVDTAKPGEWWAPMDELFHLD